MSKVEGKSKKFYGKAINLNIDFFYLPRMFNHTSSGKFKFVSPLIKCKCAQFF